MRRGSEIVCRFEILIMLLSFGMTPGLSGCSGEESTDGGECATSEDCAAGFICDFGTCAEVCVRDTECGGANEICSQGVCVEAHVGACGDDSGCFDDNPCTDDICGVGGACVHTDNSRPCDDTDTCTENDVCSGGACTGTIYSCDDSDTCTVDSCDGNGGCAHQNTCECSVAQDCNDGDICTTESCSGTSQCVYSAVTGCCNGSNDCNAPTLLCRQNACVRCLSAADCDDSDVCTDDLCDAGFACVNSAIAGCCADSTDCAGGPDIYCDNNECVECTATAQCDDSVSCTVDTCTVDKTCSNVNTCACTSDPQCAASSTPYCEGNVCVECRSASQCDDGDLCTTDTCSGFACGHVAVAGCCNAAGDCTGTPAMPYCEGNVCVACRTAADCEDLLYCTGAEACDINGVCSSAGDPCGGEQPVCNDSLDRCECNTGSCAGSLVCDSGTGLCAGCLSNGDCDDGLFCTGPETCPSGACVDGAYPCGSFSCDEPTDACVVTCSVGCGFCKLVSNACIGGPYAGSFCEIADDCCESDNCNDLDACTTGDTCTSNICSGTPISCTTPPGSCQNSVGTCVAGTCEYTDKSNGTSCGVGGTCTDGVCIGGGPGNDCRWDPCTTSAVCCVDYAFCNLTDNCCVASSGMPCP